MSFREILATPGIKPVLFTLFMAAFGFGVILPILPFYTISLGAKPAELGLLTATFAFMSLVFSPFMGNLSDRIGRKTVIMFGTACFVIGYLIFALADSLLLAFIARAIEGVGAAAIYPACISLLSDFSTEKQRGKVMGLTGMVFSLGFIIGPAIGGIVSAISVKDVFIFSAALSFANFCSVYFQIKEPKEKKESKNIVQKEIGILEHLASPLLLLFFAAFMTSFMIGGLDATLALYTGEKLGFSSPQIGIVFTYIGILIMTMMLVTGVLINRFGEKTLIRVGLSLSGMGFFLLVFTRDWLTILIPLAVFVAGNAMTFQSTISLITKKVTAKRGTVLGLFSSFESLGMFAGPILGGFLYGFDHTYAFAGFAILIWGYAVIFSIFSGKD